MKKIILLFLGFACISCSDGDFDVPSFEFTDTVNKCGEYLVYVTNTNGTEVLVLTLGKTQIGTKVGDATYPISTALKTTYRIFGDKVGTSYFCQEIPPLTPKVVKELIAESGTINITTAEVLKNGIVKGYTYTITISNLLFNDSDKRIYFENLNFGVLTINL